MMQSNEPRCPGEVIQLPVSDEVTSCGVTVASEGERLLDEVYESLTRYVVVPSHHAAVAIVLWVAATHAVEHFDHATRLAIHSPLKRCGKSRLLEVVSGLVHRPMQTTNISVAALFRMIDQAENKPPTLILDEADRIFGGKKDEENADLVAMLNNGFRRGALTYRCVGTNHTPQAFRNFAFVAIGGIGRLPDTIEDRAVNITMLRRLPGEPVHKFRLRRDLPRLEELRDQLAGWASHAVSPEAEPEVPDELEDRAADAWEPLLTIADAAGGKWPVWAREAALALAREAETEDEEQSLDLRLLADLREIFKRFSFIATRDVLLELHRIDDGPWGDFDLSARKLALRLKKFGVRPCRNSAGTERGYRRSDFDDAFARYLKSEAAQVSDLPCELPVFADIEEVV